MEVIMATNRFLRNKDLIPQAKLNHIGILGLGGIGSQLVPLLSIMGFKKITGWDHDILEEHNLSTTMYPQGALGKPKAEVAENVSKMYAINPDEVKFYDEYYDEKSPTMPKMVTCLDNMESRLVAYNLWLEQSNRKFFIDLRMGAMAMEIIVATKENDNYLDTWLPSHQISQEPCTMKHTIFTASIVGGFGVDQIFNVIAERPYYAYIWIGLMPLEMRTDNLIVKTR
jgi:hypothetical protein|tara:strand:+ start:2178 stop:2858 length:681 start_codon:yes stop_codon:yes gene_type:complete